MTPNRDADSASPLAGKRVVVVLAWSVLGGAERSALATASSLAALGAHVDVLALTADDGRGRAIFVEHGFPWHVQSTSWHGTRREKATQLTALTRALRRLDPDVVLAYTTRPNVLCALTWRATGASLMVWGQQDVGRSTKFGRRVLQLATQLTPVFVANSRDAARFLVSELGAEAGRVHTALEHLPPTEFDVALRREWRSRLGIDDVPVASMLAHLHPVKDHATLLRAWRSVLDGQIGVSPVLLLAGRPSGTSDSAKALAFDLDLGASVRFLGDVDDVAGVLAASDIAVLTSTSESRPHAVLESAAAGLPVVASDIPGIREVLGDHQAPYLVRPGDAEGFAAALTSLIRSPEQRGELGEENRRRATLDCAEPGPTMVTIVERALRREPGPSAG